MLYGKKINAVPRTKTPEQALAALMRLCARAERSEEDARRLMTRWGVAPADREQVLERLRRDRFIDDARYAEAFVREKINLSGWGARKIADALHRKRIARETIERASLRSMPVRHANGWPTCCAARCAPPAPQHLMN